MTRLAVLRLEKARLLERLGRVREALEQCEAALRADPACWEAHDRRSRIQAELGWAQDAWESVEKALELEPRSPYLLLMAAHRLEELGRYREALDVCRRLTALAPGFWEGWGKRNDLEAQLGLARDAEASLRRASRAILRELGPRPDSGPLLMKAVGLLDSAGSCQESFDVLRKAVRFLPDCAAARLRLAELHLWRGDPRGAERHCDRASALGARGPAARRIRGAAAVLRGDLREAVQSLGRTIRAGGRDPEACVWRAEARYRLGDYAAAAEDIAESDSLADETAGAPALAALIRIARGEPVPAAHYEVIRQQLPPPLKAAGSRLSPRDPRGSRRVLERVLKSLGGNRSFAKTYIRSLGGRRRLVSYKNPDLIADLLDVQTRARNEDPERVLSELSGLLRGGASENWVLIHRGEIFLWSGRYREAERDFQRALRCPKRSRWSRVGLAAAHLLLGDLAEASRCLERGIADGAPERSWRSWRGELRRLMGSPDAALEDLRRSVALTPRKISAWMNLALALDDAGDRSGRDETCRRVRAWVPHFLSVAAEAAGAERWLWPERAPSPEDRRATLLKALGLMRGNRSSWLHTYVDAGGRMRNIHARTEEGTPG
ncbi:MAG: tetratricopeptide repeat protein [Elusimicrobiota bacterium]